ncbi:hypothetical protein ABK040_013690 [Willaertia magna]
MENNVQNVKDKKEEKQSNSKLISDEDLSEDVSVEGNEDQLSTTIITSGGNKEDLFIGSEDSFLEYLLNITSPLPEPNYPSPTSFLLEIPDSPQSNK